MSALIHFVLTVRIHSFVTSVKSFTVTHVVTKEEKYADFVVIDQVIAMVARVAKNVSIVVPTAVTPVEICIIPAELVGSSDQDKWLLQQKRRGMCEKVHCDDCVVNRKSNMLYCEDCEERTSRSDCLPDLYEIGI
mmetsp:Transcript_16332/g.35300  ORF Transcript_16332/g.35300 Transcript_16332/m.35300 type:complete len:135 (+) Transcript_16332:641-1045(+)